MPFGTPQQRIIVALDVDTIQEARALVAVLSPYVGAFKIGSKLIMSSLSQILSQQGQGEVTHQAHRYTEADRRLHELRQLFVLLRDDFMLDMKFHDIPESVEGAVAGIAPMSPKFFTMHASAGREAIERAVQSRGTSQVLGVTVLTSHTPEACKEIYGIYPITAVIKFASMLVEMGAQGIVCSPEELTEITMISKFDNLVRVIPGIRPTWAAKGDQKRVTTPADAIRNGADYLVIGRPIIKPPAEVGGPVKAAQRIAEEIASVA